MKKVTALEPVALIVPVGGHARGMGNQAEEWFVPGQSIEVEEITGQMKRLGRKGVLKIEDIEEPVVAAPAKPKKADPPPKAEKKRPAKKPAEKKAAVTEDK